MREIAHFAGRLLLLVSITLLIKAFPAVGRFCIVLIIAYVIALFARWGMARFLNYFETFSNAVGLSTQARRNALSLNLMYFTLAVGLNHAFYLTPHISWNPHAHLNWFASLALLIVTWKIFRKTVSSLFPASASPKD